jgi:hypothetical protein
MAHSYSTDPFWLSLGLTFTKLKIQDAQTLIFEYANSVDELSLSPSRVWELFPLKKELFAIIYRNQHEMRKSSSKVLERKEGQGKLPNEQSLRGSSICQASVQASVAKWLLPAVPFGLLRRHLWR